jgi:hypothetical protein
MGTVNNESTIAKQQSCSIKQGISHLKGVMSGHFGARFMPNPA